MLFRSCKAEEGGDAAASLTDGNAADGMYKLCRICNLRQDIFIMIVLYHLCCDVST